MQNDKSLGNDGLMKELHETFWHELKENFVDSMKEAKKLGHLGTSQGQTIMKIIEKNKKKRLR